MSVKLKMSTSREDKMVTHDTGRGSGSASVRQQITSGGNINNCTILHRSMHLFHGSKTNWSREG